MKLSKQSVDKRGNRRTLGENEQYPQKQQYDNQGNQPPDPFLPKKREQLFDYAKSEADIFKHSFYYTKQTQV